MTLTTLLVLRELLAAKPDERYGLEITRATGVASGTLYPILKRLTAAGWLSDRAEHIDPAAEGRRPRRYYQLTPQGVDRARSAISYYTKRLAVLDQAEDGVLETQTG